VHTPEDLKQGYRRFRNGAFHQRAMLYEKLGDGQNPDIMIVACCDSRAEPAEIFDAAPGQLFVVRNVANLVPPFEETPGQHGVSAALEFAVTALRVKHIVVMGHGSCGGVSASLSAAEKEPVGQFIAPWVSILDASRDAVLATGADDPQTALEHAGIGQSLDNLMSFPFIRDAVNAGELSLHGAWFAIGKGELHWRDGQTGAFEVIS